MSTFYDQQGRAVAYRENDVIRGIDGRVLAEVKGTDVHGFSSGQHLGWLRNGWLIDHSGAHVLFSDGATGGPIKPIKQIPPIKGIKAITPIRGIRSIPAIQPILRPVWGDASSFFSE